MLVIKPYDHIAIKIDGPCTIRFNKIGTSRRQVLIDAPRSVHAGRIPVEQADAERLERVRQEQMERQAAE